MINQIQNLFESIKIRWLLVKRGLDRFVARRLGLFLRPAYNAAPKDQSRRNLLKIAGLGLGALVVGKIVGLRLGEPLAQRETSPGLAEVPASTQRGEKPTAGKQGYWQQTFLFSD